MAASAFIPNTIYLGAFVHSISLSELEICDKGAIGVDSNGVIQFVERDIELAQVQETHAEWKDAKVVKVGENGFFFPGFIGTYCFLSTYTREGGVKTAIT
jgi:guanine deaminase